MVRTRSNKTKGRTPPAAASMRSMRRGKGDALSRRKNTANKRSDYGAWPEYAHQFEEDRATQESAVVKKELFAAKNRWGRDVSFCVDSRPIDVDKDEEEAPSSTILLHEPSTVFERLPRRVTMGEEDQAPPPTPAPPAPPAVPPPSTIVRNPYAKTYKTSSSTTNKEDNNRGPPTSPMVGVAPPRDQPPKAASTAVRKLQNNNKQVQDPPTAAPPPAGPELNPQQRQDDGQKKDATAGDLLLNYAKTIRNNANAFNTLGSDEYQDAEANTKKYAKTIRNTHEKFVEIIAKATNPLTNNPGDQFMYEMFTKKVLMENGLTEDYLFYKHVTGKKNAVSREILDRALKVWAKHLKNTKTGGPLDTSTMSVRIRQLFVALHERGVQFREGDFKGKGGFIAFIKHDYNSKRRSDPSIGTKRTKAEFDEFVDEKFNKVLTDGTYKPYDNMHDLVKLLAMELGRQFGIRGGTELVGLLWSHVRMGTFKNGAMSGLKYVIIAPGGGFDKSHQLSLKNPTTTKQFPSVVEDPENPNCVVKLVFFYRERCDPKQERLLCHPNNKRNKKNTSSSSPCYYFKTNSPVGINSVRGWVKEFAEVADFKDWEKYTPHDNRHRCCTILASDLAVPEKMRMNHLRHKSSKSAEPYIHRNSVIQRTVQGVLQSGLHGGGVTSKNKPAAGAVVVRQPAAGAAVVRQQPEEKKGGKSLSCGPSPPAQKKKQAVIVTGTGGNSMKLLSPAVAADRTTISPTKMILRQQLDEARKEAAKRKNESDDFERAAKNIRCELEQAQQKIVDMHKEIESLSEDLQKKMLSEKIQEAKDIYKQKELAWEKERRSQLESELKMSQRLKELEEARRAGTAINQPPHHCIIM